MITIECPFTILIDTNEGQPFSFAGIKSGAKTKHLPYVIRRRWCNLGRHPDSFGDYSILGCVGDVAVERKSMEDAWSTILGWPTKHERENDLPSRRERFECELQNLDNCCSLVVVEASMNDCLLHAPSWGVKSLRLNRKTFFNTVLAYMQDYPNANWLFCDGRRMAEIACFRFLERYWRKRVNQ